ncbi:MAG: hypothetical protein H6828_16650 [Planctomycetes bacterium]|nr:hypothetical protein [Planctomycetota bacterium]
MQHHTTRKLRRAPHGPRLGLTLLEVTLAMGVLSVLLMGITAGFSIDLGSLGRAKRLTAGTALLQTVVEDLSAQSYDNLLALNGDQFFDGADADSSEYSVTLATFEADVDLLQVRAVLTDLDTGRELGRIVTQRSRR